MDAFGDARPALVPLDGAEDQFSLYRRVSRGYSHSFLFESLSGPDALAETSVMGFGPPAVIRGYADRTEVLEAAGPGRYETARTVRTGDPFSVVKEMVGSGAGAAPYRYAGGAAGTISYDAARLAEDVPARHGLPEGPLLEFGVYDDGIVRDNARGETFYFSYPGTDRLDEVRGALAAPPPEGEAFEVSGIAEETGPEEFGRAVEAAKRYVRSGDVFQVVLSRRFSFRARGDRAAVYGALRRLNPSPYMYHVGHGERAVVGASPEMLVRVTGRRAETFPIAGTRPVTGDARRDAELAGQLLRDEKELAEHTMLVDLGRNDLGRVCGYGSVGVDQLMAVRRFSHVQHMVTHVAGDLRDGADMYDALRAVFPAGTVSGAPKVRAMEVIDELERAPRGPYAGAVGYFSHNGCCDFAIAIRSAFFDGDAGFVQAGAGIVADSVPDAEYAETRHKAGSMLQALEEAAAG